MQELAEQPGGQVVVELVPLLLVKHVPLPRPVDGVELVGLLHHVGRVDRYRPVDPLRGIPLLVLAALIKIKQFAAALVVLPAEPCRPGGRNVPGPRLDRRGVVLVRAHGASPNAALQLDITREYGIALVPALVPAPTASQLAPVPALVPAGGLVPR